jgi:hypothetical protein
VGYFIKSGDGSVRSSTVSVTDEVWMELTEHASEAGYSAPHLRMLKVGDDPVAIDPDEAQALREALSDALYTTLKDAPTEDPDGDHLDRVTVHKVTHILRSGEVTLSRSPRWKAGD